MSDFTLQCPTPLPVDGVVQLAHGGGGRIAQRLLETVFFDAFANPILDRRHDAAVLSLGERRLAMTTDGFVVRPWRFPGGNIGSLAVHGTVNDLAMAGARPLGVSAAFILEEGFPIASLREVVDSVRTAARDAGVSIVAGDTKVVERGKGDGVYITTTGVGEVIAPDPIDPSRIRPGDAILVSGDVGRHGAAVMTAREGLELDTVILSDSAAVHHPILAMLERGVTVSCLRDATRGGIATILNELARDARVGVRIAEAAVPVADDVASVCELFGLDPLYVACEGRFVAFVPESDVDAALEVLREFEVSAGACRVGTVQGRAGEIAMTGRLGVERVLDLLSGEQLPRIC
ncbi:MAG: hydrogenase expression/formation protein HypE [Fimbriimonadaceae bacterium]|nr:hydrogenase expression/formation protein HypE [Fimbriimonadaceae bacterium]